MCACSRDIELKFPPVTRRKYAGNEAMHVSHAHVICILFFPVPFPVQLYSNFRIKPFETSKQCFLITKYKNISFFINCCLCSLCRAFLKILDNKLRHTVNVIQIYITKKWLLLNDSIKVSGHLRLIVNAYPINVTSINYLIPRKEINDPEFNITGPLYLFWKRNYV